MGATLIPCYRLIDWIYLMGSFTHHPVSNHVPLSYHWMHTGYGSKTFGHNICRHINFWKLPNLSHDKYLFTKRLWWRVSHIILYQIICSTEFTIECSRDMAATHLIIIFAHTSTLLLNFCNKEFYINLHQNQINALVQDFSISSAKALKILQSCTEASIYMPWGKCYPEAWIAKKFPWLMRNFHVKIYGSKQRFSNVPSDWLTVQSPANQKPC